MIKHTPRCLTTAMAVGAVTVAASWFAAPPASAATTTSPALDLTVPRLAPDGPPIRVRVYVEPLAPDGPPIRILLGDEPGHPSD